jgi:DNA relaxase NicK
MAITQDTNDVYCSLDHIQACFFAKKITSPLVARGAKKISSLELDGNEYPETFYIGDLKKRGEKGLFRAYDKGLELIGQRDLLIRLELESRKDIAHRNAVLIAKGQSIASVFRARFDIEDEKFQAVLDAPKTEIMRGLAKEKDKELDEMARRKKWLLEQVAPVMSKVIREEKDVEALRTFLEHFIISSGLREEMQHGANWLYGQKNLEYYGHIDRTQDKKDK